MASCVECVKTTEEVNFGELCASGVWHSMMAGLSSSRGEWPYTASPYQVAVPQPASRRIRNGSPEHDRTLTHFSPRG